MSNYRHTLESLALHHSAPRKELMELIAAPTAEVVGYASGLAREVADGVFDRKVYLRGLVEISNVCANGCYYCGLRAENKALRRYTLREEEILEACARGYALGLRSFVLQAGERNSWGEQIARLVGEIKRAMPDVAVTLSLGEQSRECYEEWRRAGADRYLLRHETASAEHYALLHPATMSHRHRLECLDVLHRLGYQRGAGFMVGTPGQGAEELAGELELLGSMRPEMVGIGPFLPQSDTPFADRLGGSVEQTLLMLSLVRLALPKALMPSTTALASAREDGSLRGLCAGANVLMPNLTPQCYRSAYAIYDGKKSTGTEAAEGLGRLCDELVGAGFEPSLTRGDHPDFVNEK